MASLTKRVVVRISDELELWIAEQAEAEGLDSATWVRSILTRMRNGRGVQQIAAQQPQPGQFADLPQEFDGPPPDPDALLSEALATAEAQGLTEPQPGEEQAPVNGVRALVRRPMPYSAAAQPGWIK
jgi:hypothetical protein